MSRVACSLWLVTLTACGSDRGAWTASLDGMDFDGASTFHLFGLDDDLLVDGYLSSKPPNSERAFINLEIADLSGVPTVRGIDFLDQDLEIGRCTPITQTLDLRSTDPKVDLTVTATVTCTDRAGDDLAFTLDIAP